MLVCAYGIPLQELRSFDHRVAEAILGGGSASDRAEAESLLVRAVEDLEAAMGPGAGPVKRARRTLERARNADDAERPGGDG